MDVESDTLFWVVGNLDTASHSSSHTHARVVELSPVTSGPQTQRDLLAYSNPSRSELPNRAAAVAQAELQSQGSGDRKRQKMRKRDKPKQKIGSQKQNDERPERDRMFDSITSKRETGEMTAERMTTCMWLEDLQATR